MYDLVFMSHWENLILLLEGHVPMKVIMKDIAEEVVVFSEDKKVSVEIEWISISIPDDIKFAYFSQIFLILFSVLSSRYFLNILIMHKKDFENLWLYL